MLIILEGPDGAGKSTLTREIAAVIGQHAQVDVMHAGPLKEHPIDAYESPLTHYRPGIRHIICDRWHLGEAVYPKIFGRETRWDRAVAEHVNLFLQSRGACVVLLMPKTSELKTRVKIRGDNLIKPDDVDAIVRGYNDITSRFITRTFDSSGSGVIATPREIIGHARQLHINATTLNKFETYVGPPDPGILILGDVRQKDARLKRPNLPAFAPFGSTSGHYLLTHLRIFSRAGLANACDVDDVRELWTALNRPKIVTLGSAAHDELVKRRMRHGAVPHPQFVRRFYFKHGDEYADVIRSAALTGKDLRSWRP